jgi:transposase
MPQRSKVETTYSMMKRKLGMKLRTKNRQSQFNEILMRCLAHNLLVLNRFIHEADIEINFPSKQEKQVAQK